MTNTQTAPNVGNLTTELIETSDQLFAIRDQIDAISKNPFLKSTWMIPWIETFCDDQCRLNFLVFKNDDSKVIGFAPLVIQNSLKRGRHFAFVGSGKCCADYMTFPTAAGFESQVASQSAKWLSENENLWDRIELDGVTTDDETMRLFTASFEEIGNQVEAEEILPSFRMPLPGSWDEVLNSLSKNSRKKYRRQARDLEGKVQLHQATDESSLEEGMQILERLHTARWESLGEGGCFASSGFGEFLNAMAKEKLAAGTLSLIWLTMDGEPIAADIGYDTGDGMFTYQGGISPDHLDCEPGRAIIKAQIETAVERGASFMDFLRGDEPYKSRFNTERIENVRHVIVGRGTRARMIQSLLTIGRALKSLID